VQPVHTPFPRLAAALVLVVSLVGVGVWWFTARPATDRFAAYERPPLGDDDTAAGVVIPQTWMPDVWLTALAGEDLAAAGLHLLADPTVAGLDAELARHLTTAAVADLPGVLADDGRTCTVTGVQATSAARIPYQGVRFPWVKVLVVFDGACPPDAVPSRQVVFAYYTDTGAGWVRRTHRYAPYSAWMPETTADPVADEATLSALTGCHADGTVRLRHDAAAAWAELCAAAAAAGVPLTATVGFTTDPDDLDGDDPCPARFCSGWAVRVGGGLDWLSDVVGCTDGVTFTDTVPCQDGARAVTRAQRYGFTRPDPAHPDRFDFVFATGDAVDACLPAAGSTVPEIVAVTWRCELGRLGVPAALVADIAAEAVVVAGCTSGWNANALDADGRYRHEPDPATGQRRTGTGVFLLTEAAADRYVPGGWAAATDPVANSRGAARIWFDAGWDPWPCASGAVGSTGGPPPPDWVRALVPPVP
jgi:hypothetical protein